MLKDKIKAHNEIKIKTTCLFFYDFNWKKGKIIFFCFKENKQMKGENSNAFAHNLMQIFFHWVADSLLILLLQKKTEYKVQNIISAAVLTCWRRLSSNEF